MTQLSLKEFQSFFSLEPIKAAKVSEISEKTASSNILPEDKVNFHIGNPVLDVKLVNYFLKALYQSDPEFTFEKFENSLSNLELEHNEIIESELIKNLVQKSSPYMPRGGYSSKSPNRLIKQFHNWLNNGQSEKLNYEIGENGSKREVTITSGGLSETLRVIFYSLSKYFQFEKVNLFSLEKELPDHITGFTKINVKHLKSNSFTDEIISFFNYFETEPVFILLGRILSEKERRELRRLMMTYPIMAIEINDAPNHLSLSRESKMEDRVIRVLSPSIFNEKFNKLALNFVCGNQYYIKIFETVHFQLLGTPSASEIELLSYLIKNYNDAISKEDFCNPEDEKTFTLNKSTIIHSPDISEIGKRITINSDKILDSISDKYAKKIEVSLNKISSRLSKVVSLGSSLKNIYSEKLVSRFLQFDDLIFQNLEKDFLSEFCTHHPEYNIDKSFAVSGSARTALGILGFHCGIEEVIIPDLSWTYEHCFPKVNVVPLKEGLKLDDVALVNFVEKKISQDPKWKSKGAVVLNNPHNASGKVFPERKLINIIKYLLNNKIYLIDDLSYQNVAPNNGELTVAKTLREIALELIRKGYVGQDKEKYLITVHSLSKTDCFAGARLSVINIPDEKLTNKFYEIKKYIRPNYAALLLGYLFYRNDPAAVKGYWKLRNMIFRERMSGISKACEKISAERNSFDIEIIPPTGSMYPQLIIHKLPSGLSLDWLASGLSNQGIGMVPLSTFARTEEGYEVARKMFRLTLGGSDNNIELERKTRRLLIDLNRLIAEESGKYNLIKLKNYYSPSGYDDKFIKNLRNKFDLISRTSLKIFTAEIKNLSSDINFEKHSKSFKDVYLQERYNTFEERLKDHLNNISLIKKRFKDEGKSFIVENLKKELFKENVSEREKNFKKRLFDRTVHPTQVYSLKIDLLFNILIHNIIDQEENNEKLIHELSKNIAFEYLGQNVAIKSVEEADELLADLETIILSEEYLYLADDEKLNSLLSFWGDWDGSNRPSGQGHRLVAAAVVENVNRMSQLLKLLVKTDKNINVNSFILSAIENLSEENKKFWKLLNKITQLTNQLEKRYQSLLPYDVKVSRIKKSAMKLGILKDPVTSLWQHNDSLEKNMLSLRTERKLRLENYFHLNKILRKELFSLIPEIEKNLHNEQLMLTASRFKNLLNRFVLTPRIHQKLITSKDQFSIDTTVHNIIELNEISGKFGNPGIVMALQVSMSSKPEALINLDRKLRTEREEALRNFPDLELPTVWSIPLFEDIDSVNGVENYLDKIWEYCIQVREINQETRERFLQTVCEVFIAGSDLSQQISQTASAALYNEVKFNVTKWMAAKGITQEVRMKLGSGEPMQRQGGYYNKFSGKSAFILSNENIKVLKNNLSDASYKSTGYATTPLLGVASRGDLRTFQSNISEHLRILNNLERTELLYHVQKLQDKHRDELVRAAEPMTETRFIFGTKGMMALERLTTGINDDIFEEFIQSAKNNFRSILYGSDEDVVGIHLISYFISRTTPTLRDRPTVRPSRDSGSDRGQQIIEKIAKTIPMNKQGSALRAIGHNRAQTVIIGVNQLTTGLFRALNEINNKYSHSGNISPVIEDSILPKLPVYEILTTLRLYQDYELKILSEMHKAFPAGNSSFLKLREDNDSMFHYIGLLQKELLRRHGINTAEFFIDNKFNQKLLPSLRPDLAVLLQNDIFNLSYENLAKEFNFDVDTEWISEVKRLLEIPVQVRSYREDIWKLLKTPIFNQVKSFVELALALNNLSNGLPANELNISSGKNLIKMDSNIVDLLKGSVDDSMMQFLQAAVHYLTSLPQNRKEIPIDIVRAIKDVERILKIEEQALGEKEQKLFNFYVLQIARMCKENG